MGGYTGYYTHLGDGGEHDLYEGETPVERQGYVTDMLSERAVALARKRPPIGSRADRESIQRTRSSPWPILAYGPRWFA